MTPDCPAEDQLVALVEGRLDVDGTSALHRHVRGCADCRLVLAGLGDAISAEQPAVSEQTSPSDLADDAPLKPGDKVGRFELSRLLGLGGMGAVWAAHDPELGRDVAVKLLRVGFGSDGDRAQSRRRLLREAKAMAHLAHPNVVPVFEVGEMGDRLFLVLELVPGETLGKWLSTPRELEEILGVFLAAGRGLSAAHQAGIVHRDFKPDNVLVGRDGRARVTDFGLARRSNTDSGPLRSVGLAELNAAPSSLTPLGSLLGTPAYMSPEQMGGGRADARSDLFSFCTALYEAVAGTRPYPGATLQAQLERANHEKLEPPKRKLPAWLRRELAKGLRADPARRHATMEQLLHALERGGPRRRLRWMAAAMAMALAMVAAGWSLRARRPAGRQSAAVVDLRDEAPQPGSAFISGALGELLATELAAGGQVRLVPQRTVAPALVDLGAAPGAALDAALVEKLRQRLDAQLVLGGSYRLDGRSLHVQLALWGKGDRPLFAAAESGPQEGLVQIARQLGARVRKSLGGPGDLATDRAQGSFPADAEAARLYVQGVSRLHVYEPGAAIESLRQAEELAPDNPRIESALAEALLLTNADVPAREAAGRAFAHKDELPPEDAARLEILRERALRNRDRAIALARAFWAQAPDDAERGQEVALLQLSLAKDFTGALATLAELRKRGDAGGPRTFVIEAQIAIASGDLQRAVAAAQRGYDQARLIGARREMAIACFWQGNALRRLGADLKLALEKQRESEELYRQAHDLGGAAQAGNQHAMMLADAGDLPAARAKFEESLAMFRQLGDRLDEGKTLHNLSIVLRRMRDLPGAIERSKEAESLFFEVGDRQSAANALATLGHLRWDLGDLPGSIAALDESARIRRELKDPMMVTSLHGLAMAHLSMGDLPAARRYMQEALGVSGVQEKQHASELREGQAQIDLAAGKLADAEAESRQCAQLATQVDEGALCQAVLAAALLKQGKVAQARAEVDRGLSLVAKSRTAIARGELLVMDGRVKAAESDVPGAVEVLHKALAEATQAGVASDQWDARLALAELAPAESRAMVRARLRTLAAQARAQGFGLFALYADSAARR